MELTERIIQHAKQAADAKISQHARNGHDSCFSLYQIIGLSFGIRSWMHSKQPDASPHNFGKPIRV